MGSKLNKVITSHKILCRGTCRKSDDVVDVLPFFESKEVGFDVIVNIFEDGFSLPLCIYHLEGKCLVDSRESDNSDAGDCYNYSKSRDYSKE